jgi:hypothetical protein
MLHRVKSLAAMKFSRSLFASAVAASLAMLASAAQAQQPDAFGADVELDTIATDVVDRAVFATLMPNPDVADPALLKSAIAAALATPNHKPKPFVPITVASDAVKPALKPVRIDYNAPGNRLVLDNNQQVQLHADGVPAPNGPDRDPLVRVMPRQADPSAVFLGARWDAQDRLRAPLLPSLAFDAHADVLTGAPPPRAGNVRRSLRITAIWDDPEDISVGFTPGFTRGGGMAFEHYVAGLEVSTLDKSKTARWRSYVELSGEKLAFNNVIENSTAHVAAGASYATSSSTQLDISVSRGTTWQATDLQSSVGLSVHF